MVKYQTLEDISLEVIYRAFLDVFSDYQVKFQISYEDFLATLSRKGYSPHFSVGAFCGRQLVGFVLNGLREWDHQLTMYDLGTGVIPEMRRRGLTGRMLSEVKKIMEQKNVKQYLLEVLQMNEKALRLYQKEGFQIRRELKCYQIKKEQYSFVQRHETKTSEFPDDSRLEEFWNCRPSWQNSKEALAAVRERCFCAAVYEQKKMVGYGVIDRMTGDIGQIAVAPACRRKGIGRSILSELIKGTEASLIRVLNVEDTDMQQFLSRAGFENYVDQYEMILKL